MLISLHYVNWIVTITCVVVCVSDSAHAGDLISKEITQKYKEAGGIPITVRCWGGSGKKYLSGRVPGFHFYQAPTGKLPAIPVPCGLTLSRDMFYANLPVNPTPNGVDLTPFLHLENLTDLSLDLGGSADKKILSQVWQFKKLKHLQITADLSDRDMNHLINLKSLESLELDRSGVTDQGIAKLASLKDLKALDLSGAAYIKGIGFKHAQKFESLSILILPGTVSDAGLECVANLKRLRVLEVPSGLSYTNKGLSKLGTLSQLKSLKIDCSRLTDEGLEGIARLDGLHSVEVAWANITDDGLRLLVNLQQLTMLKLSACRKITDVAPLSNLEKLQTLELSYCAGLTDESFEEIGKLQQLTYLWMPRVPITDAGVKHIAKLKNLETLSLWGSEVTDDCIDDVATMKSLNKLYLGRTKITPTGRERLQKLLPECEI